MNTDMSPKQLIILTVLCLIGMIAAAFIPSCTGEIGCPEPDLLDAVSSAVLSDCEPDGPTAFRCASGHVGALNGRKAVIYFPAYHAHTAIWGVVECAADACECEVTR